MAQGGAELRCRDKEMVAAEGSKGKNGHVGSGKRPSYPRHKACERWLQLKVEGDQAVG